MKFLLLLLALTTWSCQAHAFDSPPFSDVKTTTIEGTFRQVSKLPKADTNPYPDCYYTAIVEISSIISGEKIPKKVVLVLPGFFSRRYAPEAHFKAGDKIEATVVPFASMPEKVKQTQQADEIESIDLDLFYPEKVHVIQDFSQTKRSISFVAKVKPSDPVLFQHKDAEAASARQNAIQHDLKEINEVLAQHGGDWETWYQALKPFREQYQRQFDAKTKKWIGDSFFSAGYVSDKRAYNPAFIRSIIAFDKYLKARNIDLILVRVPYKGEVVDDLFSTIPANEATNPYLLKMYKELLEANVEVITDIIPRAKESRFKFPLMYWYDDFQERHPAEGIAWVVAESLSQRLERYDRIRNHEKLPLKLDKLSTSLDSDSWLWAVEKCNPFWPAGNPKLNPKDHVTFSAVLTKEGKPLQRQQGTDSPILVVGSSFLDYPSYKHGANIPAYLAYLTGVNPDMLYRAGADASIPRILAREGDGFLRNRSVCLFPMVPMAFEGALDVPPIVDPGQSRVLLTSLSKRLLQEKIQLDPKTLPENFSYTPDGSLDLHASSKQSRTAVSFEFSLPQDIASYPYFMIEAISRPGDGAVIQAKYGDETAEIHKSYSQKNKDDYIFFKTGTGSKVTINISNIRMDFPTVIHELNIYGFNR